MTCIHELFEAQAALTPDADALIFEAERLSYRELNERADKLAHALRAHGVGPDVLVAIFLERSTDMVAGMLAVLKAGGAYVPLDPVLPGKRLAYMLADARPLIVLTQKRLQSQLPAHDAQVVLMDGMYSAKVAPAASHIRAIFPNDLAYVIYTSGSTGKPKGVEIKHSAVVNMLVSMERRPGLRPTDRMLALTTIAFDIAVLEIFLPLICGACTVIATSQTAHDGMALMDLINRSSITVMQATPATLQMLLDAGWDGVAGLKILCGGEAWSAGLAAELLTRCGSLWNMYGPTETTVWSAVAKVEEGGPIVIGRPVANTRLYVLDKTFQLVPVGVPGELHIGGYGIARGYLNRPELTAERFIADPFVESGALMYRTGDLVKRLPNGTFEFLGRLDQQVKIRGHRIELGEIESVLASHPGIERSVAVAYEGADGHQNLAVYFIGAAGATTSSSEIRLFLGDLLPPYMIPASFIPVSGFPLTPSGKLDRKALPPPDAPVLETDATFVEPVTPREKQLADIWGEMLNHNPVGLHDNFFDLGGHSLLALRTINEINKRLGVFLNVPDFFQSPTIEQLGRTIDHRMHAKPASQVVQIQQGRAGLPVYFIGARPDEYRLAQMIGGDRSIFVIDALIPTKWISAVANEDQAVLPTIEQLGELFGRALVAHAGSDPCIIAGYSLGGKIAFEAAHKLQQAGGNARFVLLVDARSFAWSGASRIVAIWRSLWMVLGNDVQGNNEGISYKRKLGTVSKGFVRLARWQIAEIRKAIKYRYEISCRRLHAARNHVMPVAKPSGYVDSNGKPIDMWYIHRLSALAGRSWRPRPLDTAGVLIRVKTRIDILPSYDRANGWRDLFANGLEIVQADGNHMSILTGDHAISLARQLNDVLDRYGSFQITPEAAFKNIDTGLTPEQCGLKQVPLKNQVEDLDICVPVAGRP